MRSNLRWCVLPSVATTALITGVALFWVATEAPQRPIESSDETPIVESPTAPAQLAPLQIAPPLVVAASSFVEVSGNPASSQDVRAPILMYHRIDWLPPNADTLRKSLSISPADFDSQVHFLKDRGFSSLTLYDLYEALQGKRKPPPKPVILTFDDGYADNYANAFPVLKRYGFTGTFFVLTDFVGTGEYMSWTQLAEMAAEGMKIEVHGRTHSDLTKMSAAGVASQAKGAREAILARIGVTPMFYSYPSGSYNKDVVDIIKANGYLGAATTNYGVDHSLQKVFELKRVRIDGRDSFSVFARKVGENP